MRAAPAESSRIHWGLTRPYDAHAEIGKRVARPRNEATRHNSVASSVWQRTQACNRSREWERDTPPSPYPRPRQRRDSADRPRLWAPLPRAPKIQPAPSETDHRARQPAGRTDPLEYRAGWRTMEHHDRDRPHETQHPRGISTAPLGGQSREYPPRDDYGRRSPPPARSRSLPAHAISDSDESDTETHPRWIDLSPRKAPRRDDDAFVDDHLSDDDVTRIPLTNLTGRSRLPRMSRNLNPRLQETRLTPRDFDPDRAESVASNEDEPDFSFAAIVDMIRNYHSMERPTTTAPTRTTRVFDQTRGVQSDRGPAFNLPTSPLLGGLIDNANSAMARLTREQSNGFLPFPMKRHWRFYRTDATSLSAPYLAPPSLAFLTREKPCNSKRRLFPLSQSVLAGLESAMASVAETASWLDWWLSTVSGFSEALQPSARPNFERLLVSGSKAIAFVGSQTVPALTNLLLSHRDTLLAEFRYTVPVEELALLRHSPMPPSAEIFPSTRLDTALSKARAASNNALVHKALQHPPPPPKRPAQGNGRSNPTYRSGDSSGRSPLTPRHQQPQRPNNQSNAQAPNNNGRKRGNRRPFPRPTGRSEYSGGKGKGSGKRSN